jgi:hypothetical protein
MVRNDRRRTYKGTIFKNQSQADTYDDIAIWGRYTPSHDNDFLRAEVDLGKRDAKFWNKKLGNYDTGLVTDKQYDSINAIADEDDLDHLRGMSEDRKKKTSRPKPKRKVIKKCKCK